MFKIIRNIFNAIEDVLERFLIKATHYIEGPDASYIEEIKNMEEAVNHNSDNALKRAMMSIGEASQRIVKNSHSRQTPTEMSPAPEPAPKRNETPKISHDSINHELEEMINSLQSQWNNSRTAILELNDRVTEVQLKQLTQSYHDSTPHIRIEFYDTCDVPKVWVDGKRVDKELVRINVDWNTNTQVEERKTFRVEWLYADDNGMLQQGVNQDNML